MCESPKPPAWDEGRRHRPRYRILALAFLLVWTPALSRAAAAADDPSFLPAGPNPGKPAPGKKLRVTDPALARQIEAQGGRLLADYGSFQLFGVDSTIALQFARLRGVEARDEYDRILLNAGTIDTATPRVRARLGTTGPFTGKRLHLVQFVGPVQPAWYAELERMGLEVVDYIPHNAYLVYGDYGSVERLQGLARSSPHVQWEGPFRNEYRLHPSLTARVRARNAAQGQAAGPGSDLYAIQMVDDPPATAATLRVVDGVRVGPVESRFGVRDHVNVITHLGPAGLAAVAARPDVISVQPYVVPVKRDERQDQVLAGNVANGSPSAPGYLDFLASKGFGLAASAFAVDVTDSGIDDGTTSPNHFGLYESGNIAGQSRVVYNRLEGTPHAGSTLQGCDGHGTINAHIVAGFSNGTGFPYADAEGFDFGLGVAPFAKVGSSVIFDPDTYTYPSFPDLQSRAYRDGARISSNSWGGVVNGLYNVDSQAYDALVRDAQPAGSAVPAAGNQQMVIVFAAGNEGPASQSLLAPGTAKNVLTVGATEGDQPFGAPDQCGVDDVDADNTEDIAFFSSRGPTTDGRRKPDIVAPGTHVSGGVFQQNPVAGGTGQLGQAGACFTGSGVCGGTSGPFYPDGQELYTASSGTSHSTPAVSGGAALVRQFFVNQGWSAPSPAMTKAFLMNSARYLTGADAGDSLWSNAQGMGMMDLASAFDGAARILRDQVAGDTFTASGQTRQVVGTITDSSRPFRVTLAWTDAPGSTAGSAFNNDLDLVVQVAGATYHGNVFSGPNSVPGGTTDLRDNVESVFLPAGQGGTFVVTVSAANINSDGVPGSGGALDQDFALVVYNGQETPVPVIVGAGGTLAAESCGAGNGAIDPGETVTVALGLANTGTADTQNLVATLLPTGGVTAPSAPQDYGVAAAGGAAVVRPFTFTAAGTCGGTVTATLQLQDGGTNLGTASFTFPLGTVAPGGPVVTNDNTSAITIPSQGPATPYPSTINVAGLVGPVTKVTATLHGFSHAFPDDVDVLLVGPEGQRVLLMSDAGGGGAVSNLNLTFDDDAAASLPDGATLTSGTYRPSNYEGFSTDNFPAPAPSGPFDTALSAFVGTNPNGAWSLYVQDDFTGLSGSIAGGWSLSLTTGTPVCCVGPGIAVAPTSGLVTTEAGGTATFTVVLNTTPTADVTIGLSSSDPSEGTVSPASLTFTPGNALTPQTVTVTGVDDTVVDGNVAYSVVTAPAVSADGTYAGLDAPDVSVTNDDDDVASIQVSPTSGLVTTEAGGTATFTVVLGSTPTANVTIGLSSSDTTEGTVSPASLTFTPANALTPQTVTVTGVSDTIDDGDVAYTIVTAPAVSADGVYNGRDAPDVSVVNRDVIPGEPAVWTAAVGVAVSANDLTKTAVTGWNAGAVSTKSLPSGDGYVAFRASETTTLRVLGLSNGNDDTGYADVDFGLYLAASQVQVLEKGVVRGIFGSYATGDSFRVAVQSGVVKYFRNGLAFYTSAMAPTYPLLVDTALYTQGATLTGVVISSGWTAPPPPPTGEPVSWTAAVGVSVSGNNLTKTAATGWNAGAISTKSLPSGDGYVAFTASETTTLRMLGLSNGNTDTGYADVDFAIYLMAGQVQVFEKGAGRGSFGTYATGDSFQVAVQSGVVTYSRNGVVFYTSAMAPTYPLLVDTALYTQGATLTGAVISGAWVAPPPPTDEPVSWTAAVGVSVSGNNLTKTDVTGWNAGAASTKSLSSGDGYVAFTASETSTLRMIGLSNGNDDTSYADIDFAVYLAAGQVQVFEKGSLRGSFGAFATGDSFRVAVQSGVVKYSQNGAVFYTSAMTPTYPLLVDTALYTQGATLTGVVISSGWTAPPPPPTGEAVSWTAAVGVSVSGNNLTKTAATGWNAGAISTKSLPAGDGYVAFTASETSTLRMIGLSNGNTDTGYADIDFAIYLMAGQVQVFEMGAGRGSFGTYATGDSFQVAVQSGVVKYSRNGVVFYTSAMAPTYPLLVDTALYTQGATLTSVVISSGWTAPPPPPTGEAVSWTAAVGVSVSGNNLTKTAAAGWNAGAVSTRSLSSGDGYVAFTASETSTLRMIGLSNGNTDTSYADIDFAIYLAGSQVQIFEKGALRGSFGSFATGDFLQVMVQSGVVKYSRNGVVLYTSAMAPTYPLLVDTALYSQGATLTGVVLSGNLQ